MASPSSTTIQSQGGTDSSVTAPTTPGRSESTQTTSGSTKSSIVRARPDFTITFTLKPSSPPKGQPIQA